MSVNPKLIYHSNCLAPKFRKVICSLIFLLSAVVDLTDENGSLKCIHERPPDQFASEYLQGRGTYVLLKVLSKLSFNTFL